MSIKPIDIVAKLDMYDFMLVEISFSDFVEELLTTDPTISLSDKEWKDLAWFATSDLQRLNCDAYRCYQEWRSTQWRKE